MTVALLAITLSTTVAADKLPFSLSDTDFWRMISEFSEPGGNYPYENFVSNEWNQQKVVPALRRVHLPTCRKPGADGGEKG